MPNPLYTYILNMYYLVWFYGISTLVGYLMPNPVHTYILNMYMICKHFLHNILKWTWALFKWFQVFLYNRNNLTLVICLHTVCSTWPIDRTLSGATIPGQSGPVSNGNERVLHIPQTSKAGTSLSDGLMSYSEHSLDWSILPPPQWCSQPTELSAVILINP